MMNVHFSIDDVIQPFLTLASEQPDSVFDVPFFSILRDLNKKYGAVITLYCYCIYEADGSCLDRVPERYWMELLSAGFIKLGFHGCFSFEGSIKFIQHGKIFHDTVPQELLSSTLRLHKYMADSEIIDFLKSKGVNQLFCRDNFTRSLYSTPASYILNDEQMNILDHNILTIDGMTYRKTNIMLECYSSKEIREELKKLVLNAFDDRIVVFTHNKVLDNNSELIFNTFADMSELNVKYIF